MERVLEPNLRCENLGFSVMIFLLPRCRLSNPRWRLCQATPPMPLNDAQTVGVTHLLRTNRIRRPPSCALDAVCSKGMAM